MVVLQDKVEKALDKEIQKRDKELQEVVNQ
jgi:hypothetical protein